MADDGGDGAAGGLDIGEHAQESLDCFREGKQPDGDLGGDAKGTLRAHENAPQVVPWNFPGPGAQVDHGAVFQRHPHAQDMVGGGAVGQAVRAAGVFRDVPAQAARLLAGRVGGVAHAELADVGVQVQVDYARLDGGSAVLGVHLEDAVHAGEGNLDAPGRGQGPAAETGTRPPPGHGDSLAVGQGQSAAYLVLVGGQDHRAGH